jgi:chromosome segregation ATPase
VNFAVSKAYYIKHLNTTLSIEDFDNDELNYAQVKALALSEPLMKEYAEKENELRNARMILRQELAQKETAKSEIAKIAEDKKRLLTELERTKENAEYIAGYLQALNEQFDTVADILTRRLPHAAPHEALAVIGEFCISAPHSQSEKKLFAIFERLGISYYLEFGNSMTGNKTRISNFFSKFSTQIESREKRIEVLQKKQQALSGQLSYSSKISNRIETLEREIKGLFEKISIKSEETNEKL